MDGSSGTGHFSDPAQSRQRARQSQPRRNTLGVATPLSSTNNLIILPLPRPPLDLLPTYLPPSQASFQQQLVDYNRLVESGIAKSNHHPSSPLPPLPSDQSSRFATSYEPSHHPLSSARGNGNRQLSRSIMGERSFTTKEVGASMADRKYDIPKQRSSRSIDQQHESNPVQQSNSVPSTPHQRARNFSSSSREPSPIPGPNHSPRSAYSETTPSLPSLRPLPTRAIQQCKYETSNQKARRRIPYSIGTDRLEKTDNVKAELTKGENQRLSNDMWQLYDALLPTPLGEANRTRFVVKLEKMLNDEWPGHEIKVHLFGSSGNMLCTDDSDVDICITTPWKELENVCKIADLLARNGMKKVVCVPAKVPIVKAWDPEFNIACDMNVNNTLALENTRMLRTYVEIDERVRPLAIIIKHWTKRRVVNDAAFGATLSSYTWICMVINFLQTRNPPILPALHQCPELALPSTDGHVTEFADDIEKLKGFGVNNKEDIAELLFHFFRFYGHEMDYDKHVVSVRNGKLLLKKEKAWHLATNNMLCVEEPFNTIRNLANTADDTSFRGLHIEIRRAFDHIAEADLELCCEQYIFPKEEERFYERPAQQSKPIISRTPSQSSNRNNRGGYQRGRGTRNSGGPRRVSVGAYDNPIHTQTFAQASQPYMPAEWISAQNRMLNDLKERENNLRNVLFQQSQQYAQIQAHAQFRANRTEAENTTTERNRGMSFDNPPLTAPIRPDTYFYPLLQPATLYSSHGPSGYPTPCIVGPAISDMRHSHQRSVMTNAPGVMNGSGSALRSHSQPASRPVQIPVPAMQGIPMSNFAGSQVLYHPQNGMPISVLLPRTDHDGTFEHKQFGPSSTSPPNNLFPKEYIGYFVSPPHGQQPSPYYTAAAPRTSQPPSRRESMVVPPIPAYGERLPSNRRPSTDQFPHAILERVRRSSRSPSPRDYNRDVDRSEGPHAPATYLSPPMMSEQVPAVVDNHRTSSHNGQHNSYAMSESSISEGLVPVNESALAVEHNGIPVATHDVFGIQQDRSSNVLSHEATQQRSPILPTSMLPLEMDTAVHHNSRVLNGVETSDAKESQLSATSVAPIFANSSAGRHPMPNGSAISSRPGTLTSGLVESEMAHLSPVHEMPSPLYVMEGRSGLEIGSNNAENDDRANSKGAVLTNGTSKAKGRLTAPSSSNQPRAETETDHNEPQKHSHPPRASTASKPNGHKTVKSEGSVTHDEHWQQAKSKPKKKPTPTGHKKGQPASTSGEKMPVRDSDRKGG